MIFIKKEYTTSEIENIIHRYLTNESIVGIANSLGRSESVVKRLLKINKIPIRKSSPRYIFNKDIFNIIDSEQKAYWIGFIWCDGYNGKRDRGNKGNITYEFKLSLMESDELHLYKFRNFLGSNHLIKKYNYDSNFGEGTEARILISSTEFGRMLDEKYGLIANRFDATKLINSIPKAFIRDFIRGVLDADGSIVLSNTNDKGRISDKLAVNISTYETILEFINQYLEDEGIINVKSKLYTRHEDRDGYCKCVKYCGNINGLKLLDWLYADSQVYLTRKYEKYIEIKNKLKK